MSRKTGDTFVHDMLDLYFNQALNQLHWAITNELIEQGDLEYDHPQQLLAGSDYHIDQFIQKAYLSLSQIDWFDREGYLVRGIPQLCVAECSHSGPCDADVSRWQKVLGFNVPRITAIEYLVEFGAWDHQALSQMLTTNLSEIVLWIACGYLSDEDHKWLGLVW